MSILNAIWNGVPPLIGGVVPSAPLSPAFKPGDQLIVDPNGNLLPMAMPYINPPQIDPYSNRPSLEAMIFMRMGWVSAGQTVPLQHLSAVKAQKENKVFVFVVHNDQAVIIEDGDLFPSDMLITKLRLLIG